MPYRAALPPIWKRDAYLIRPLVSNIRSISERLVRNGFVIVDMGCGDLPYRHLFTDKGARYLGADIEGTAADIVLHPGSPVPIDSKNVNMVVSFQVLEHVWDIDWYLSEAHRILVDDGKLVLSTHGVWPYHPHPTDYRRWTCEGLVKEVESRGFKVEEFTGMVGPIAWTTLFNVLAISKLMHKLPLVGRVLSGCFCTVFYVIMKLGDLITPSVWVRQNASNYILVAKKA